jgi:hypothetical protein
MMTSTEIAELFCKVICGEALPEDLEPFVSEEAIWTVLPVEKVEAASVEDTNHIRFFGPPGIGDLLAFLQGSLEVVSGEMTGCIVKGDITFVFGKITLRTLVNQMIAATAFSAQLSFRSSKIVICRLKLLWPLFDPAPSSPA